MASDKFLATVSVLVLVLALCTFIVSQGGVALMLPGEITKILELLHAS